MMVVCPHCGGDGYVEREFQGETCPVCRGVGLVPLTASEREIIRQALRLLHQSRPMLRCLGRAASPREIVALAGKLSVRFREGRAAVGGG